MAELDRLGHTVDGPFGTLADNVPFEEWGQLHGQRYLLGRDFGAGEVQAIRQVSQLIEVILHSYRDWLAMCCQEEMETTPVPVFLFDTLIDWLTDNHGCLPDTLEDSCIPKVEEFLSALRTEAEMDESDDACEGGLALSIGADKHPDGRSRVLEQSTRDQKTEQDESVFDQSGSDDIR